MRSKNEILFELNELSSSRDFLEVLLILCNTNLNCTADKIATRNLRNILNENEITFLFGIWLKNRNKNKTGFIDKLEVANRVHQLMDDFHSTFLSGLSLLKSDLTFHEQARNNPEIVKETIFYSGTGAYDYQMMQFLEAKYKFDETWLRKNKKFLFKEVIDLFVYIKSTLTYKLNSKKYGNKLVELYCLNRNNYVFKKNPHFLIILDLFSFEPDETINENFSDVGDLNFFKFKPVIKTASKYIIPLPYLLSEAIYESPFYWMLEDKEYKSLALKNRGDSAERIVKSILDRKIKDGKTYLEVDVKEVKAETVTDLDVCIVNGNKMLIFQVKSKRLTQLSKKGNIEQFQKDFKQAIQDAHNQATKPIPLILSNSCSLKSSISGEIIDCTQIDEIYSICVVLDNYPAVTTHTRMFFHDEETTPVTMSIFDLDLIINYIDDFDMLFDYIKKRVKFSKYFIAESELCFFSNYLKNDLFETPNSDMMMLDINFAQRFDFDFYYPLMKKYESKYPDFIKEIGRNDFCFCGSGIKFKKCCK